MTHDQLVRVVVSTSTGLFIGWAATALTLAGRVTAIEQSLLRIEARLEHTPQKGPTP